ncbi:MAG: cobalt-precorrin-5B (C(1))-methyltransferase CbiD [Lachnospiraceae bacterium]|nr:cobalt-precorrin-5B (C(1))-methyltransferase CbiD [Lachnospiraceae bacterium]
MKKGFTTGSCAAAAAKAAAMMLLGSVKTDSVEIDTPAGLKYKTQIEGTDIGKDYVRCAVRKQSGDDPDITDGIPVFARVSYGSDDDASKNETGIIIIEGGEGIGRVTRPGLDQPVGNAAINSVPRQMIEREVRQVTDFFEYRGALRVEISVPGGEELALKTFNPRLGIEGGISIIGTTGIVEPMSTKALLDTIRVELRQLRSMGAKVAVISPGNYGLEFMKTHFGYDLNRAVKCSNFIGDTIDMAAEEGFKKLVLCGHLGKLIKVSGGIMNTHSREADCRMELMACAAIECGADAETASEILGCVSTEEATEIYLKAGIEKKCFEHILERTVYYLGKRGNGRLDIQCIIFTGKYGILGQTVYAEEYLAKSIL